MATLRKSPPGKLKPESKPRGLVQRKSGEEQRRLVVYLPMETGRELAVRCAERGITLSDAVTAAVTDWLKHGGK